MSRILGVWIYKMGVTRFLFMREIYIWTDFDHSEALRKGKFVDWRLASIWGKLRLSLDFFSKCLYC